MGGCLSIGMYKVGRINLQIRKKSDKNDIYGHGQAVAAAWLFMILAILPLYMRDGLNWIGDAKYSFYRNVSALFLAMSAITFIASGIRSLSDGKREFWRRMEWSAVDICILVYGAVSVISFFLSEYPTTALWGYQDWYMGLLTQLFMIGGYFCISRCYRREGWVETAILLSASGVSLLGVLNRFELDPLNVFSEMDRYDWNRTNLLSTIGNINWYCGYLSVAVPILAVAYWNWRGHWSVRLALGFGLLSGLTALFVQGSDSGYAALTVLMLVLLFASLMDRERILRFLEITMMLPLACLLMCIIAEVKGVGLFLPNGSTVTNIVYSPIWIFVLVFLLVCYLFIRYCRLKPSDSNGKKYIIWIAATVVLVLIGAVAFVFISCQISVEFWQRLGGISLLRFSDEWGNGRGFLWRVTWHSFWKSDILLKLFGAGPDCYAEYMYRHASMDLQVSGQFQDAIFANAHNEWLTMFLNEGLLGGIAYMGFFLTAFFRFFRRVDTQPALLIGALAVVTYSINSFFSFQQVVSTPLIFMLIGACEASCRRLSSEGQRK